MKDIGINQTELSNRAKNCLKRNDIFLLSQMMQLSNEDIHKFRNAGEKTVQEIISLQQQIKDSGEHIDADDIAFVLEKENSRPELMIHMAFPNLRGKEVDVMTFEDKNGLYSMDTKIEDINFSVRLNHCLLQNDLIYISEVANTEYDKVVKYKNMGQKSINELIEYLRAHTRFTIVESNKENIVNRIFKCIEEKMNTENLDYNKNGRRTKEDFARLLLQTDYDKLFVSFFDEYIMYDCRSVEEVKEDMPGRNSSAHSWYNKYPSRKAALNAILFTDFLLDIEPLEQKEYHT